MPSNIRENLTRKATQIMKKIGNDPLNIHKQWALALKNFFTINETALTDSFSNQIAPSLINSFLNRNHILTFSFVRHPFERLVSAYNDKFRGNQIRGFGESNSEFVKEWFAKEKSFSSFVNFILYQYQQRCYPNYTKYSWRRTNLFNKTCKYNGKIFIDAHWRPFAFKCLYCDINYDVIGRLETWNDDVTYIIRKWGLEKVLPLKKATNAHEHSAEETHQNTIEKTKEYFSKLSKTQKNDLYHMFSMDFEMFNYDPKIYF